MDSTVSTFTTGHRAYNTGSQPFGLGLLAQVLDPAAPEVLAVKDILPESESIVNDLPVQKEEKYAQSFTLYFDGSCGPKNPGGTAAYGFALYATGSKEPTEKGSGVIGTGPNMSNNLAEFRALSEGLLAYLRHNPEGRAPLMVYGDSNLVIKMMQGFWKPSDTKLYYPACVEALANLKKIRRRQTTVTFAHVPREHNTLCDDLSKGHRPAKPKKVRKGGY